MPEFVLVHVARTLQPPLLEAQLSVPAHIDNIHIALLSASTVALHIKLAVVYLRQRGGYIMFLSARVCLPVCKITQKRVHGFG